MGECGKEVTGEEVGGDIGVWNSLGFNKPADGNLGAQCRLCRLDNMETVHVVTKLGREKSLQNNQRSTRSS